MASVYCELTTRQAPHRELCKRDSLTPTQLSASGTTIIPICREAHLVSEIRSNVSKATQVTTEIDPLQGLYQLLQSLLPKQGTQMFAYGPFPAVCLPLGRSFLTRPALPSSWPRLVWPQCDAATQLRMKWAVTCSPEKC